MMFDLTNQGTSVPVPRLSPIFPESLSKGDFFWYTSQTNSSQPKRAYFAKFICWDEGEIIIRTHKGVVKALRPQRYFFFPYILGSSVLTSKIILIK